MKPTITPRAIAAAYRKNSPDQLVHIAAMLYIRGNEIRESLYRDGDLIESASRSGNGHYLSEVLRTYLGKRFDLMSLAVRLGEDNESWDRFWSEVERLEQYKIVPRFWY